jgi:hypothetical protein
MEPNPDGVGHELLERRAREARVGRCFALRRGLALVRDVRDEGELGGEWGVGSGKLGVL